MNLNEFELIDIIRRSSAKARGRLLLGIGDDCAVIGEKSGRSLLVTTDMLVEGVHFTSKHDPLLVGQKAMLSNISDIAAMGGQPLYALISVGLKKEKAASYAFKLYRGLRSAAKKHKVGIIGGDTVSSAKTVINITLLGETSGKKYIKRNGAKEGDFIVVTGTLGAGAAHLLNGKVYVPRLKVSFAQALATAGLANAMIDVSDGLSSEIHHLAKESGLGALIAKKSIPLSAFTLKTAQRKKKDAFLLALNGGEDYELLFTMSPKKLRLVLKLAVEFGIKASVLGVMLPKKMGVNISDLDNRLYPLKREGFDHFI